MHFHLSVFNAPGCWHLYLYGTEQSRLNGSQVRTLLFSDTKYSLNANIEYDGRPPHAWHSLPFVLNFV